MTDRVVTTQEELDAALTEGAHAIHIDSPAGVWLTIGDTGDSAVTVRGSSHVETLWGSVGEVTGSGSVGRVTGSGSVGEVTDSGRVNWVTGSGSVGRVTGSGRVGEVTDSGSVGRVTGSGSVGRVTGSGRVGEVTGSGSVGRVTDSGRVNWVTGSGRVGEVTGSGRVERASGTAVVHLYSRSTLKRAGSSVAVFLHSATATVNGGNIIDLTELDQTDPGAWCAHQAVDCVDGVATLYKAVHDDLRSNHGFAYPIGATVACEDWRDDAECGHGLHLSPSVREARDYDQDATRFLECRVPVTDLRPLLGGTAKCKTPRAEVVCEVDEWGAPVPAKSGAES